MVQRNGGGVGMSILVRLQMQREAARETKVQPQQLSQDAKSQVQQAGLQLVKNEVSQAQEAGPNGRVVNPRWYPQNNSSSICSIGESANGSFTFRSRS